MKSVPILFFLSLLVLNSCTKQQTTEATEIVDGICFTNLDDVRTHLPEQFVKKLMSGNKGEIVYQAQEINEFFNFNASLSPRYCNPDIEDLMGYSMSFPTEDKRYIMGRIELYFSDEKLKVAETTMILLP